MKTICLIVAIALSLGLIGCDRIDLSSGFKGFSVPEIKNVRFDNASNLLSEVAPPDVISQLEATLSKYQPKVTIVSPRHNTTVQDTTVQVSLTVQDYSLFKDERLGLGPHLNLIVDNEHYEEIYNLDEPIMVKDLKPGTHTIRVLAEKPWHESFKNQEAFAQTTFNVLTETQNNNPNAELPLLTYNQPDGIYTAEPIMLDFYLTGIEMDDWQVKAKINGESFTIDEWQPFYLKGFQEGNNLIELELLDSQGQVIENTFNKTIRLITYVGASTEDDTLAQLVSNKIPFTEAVAITEQNYYIQPVGEPEEIETITEDSSLKAASEAEITEPTVEDITSDREENIGKQLNTEETETEVKAVEDLGEAKSNVEPEVIPKVSEISEPTVENSNSFADLKNQTIEEKIEIPVTSQEVEITIPPSTSKEISVTATPIEEKITSTELNSEQTTGIEQIIITPTEGETTIKITETVVAPDRVESNDPSVESQTRKFKVPQWWKTFRINLQKVVQNATNKVKALFNA